MRNQILQSIIEITRQRDLDSLECSLLATVTELVNATTISLYKLVDKNRTDVVEEIVRMDTAQDNKGSVDYVWDTEHRIVNSDDQLQRCLNYGKPIEYKSDNRNSHLLMPIKVDGKLFGALALQGSKDWSAYRTLLEGFIKIYTNNLTILRESERDKLTGLLNRRTFDNKIDKLLKTQRNKAELYKSNGEHERRKPGPDACAWLVMVDIDHFKRVNDTYGHLYGDEVILTLSQLMRKSFRSSDLMFRFGGEEFVIVLEPVTHDTAYMVLERFREAIAAHEFPQVGQVTISIGFTKITLNDYPPTVLDNADKALYYAKENGRNCVYNYETLLAQGKVRGPAASGSVDLF